MEIVALSNDDEVFSWYFSSSKFIEAQDAYKKTLGEEFL